jgi:RimJ/RimL family protein N-acetyltransferase
MPTPGPPYRDAPQRIDLGDGLALAAVGPDHVAELVELINVDIDHLRPWMPWAQSPVTDESQREFVTGARAAWADGKEFTYVVERGGHIVGAAGLHARRGRGVLEIGYWLRSTEQGRGTATRAARALVDVAVAVGAEHVEVRCDEANLRSAAVPRRLGFTLVAVEDVDVAAPGETGRHQVWSLAAADAGSG